jgi:hypothetical protein
MQSVKVKYNMINLEKENHNKEDNPWETIDLDSNKSISIERS